MGLSNRYFNSNALKPKFCAQNFTNCPNFDKEPFTTWNGAVLFRIRFYMNYILKFMLHYI